MKKLPIGIQDFEKIINKHYIYVDKTAFIYELITSGEYYFLSRPRRFGKSLLVSTLAAIFSGKRELFKNLAIDSLFYDWQKYPVITISLSDIPCESPEEFKQGLKRYLHTIANRHNIILHETLLPGEMLRDLAHTLAQTNKI